ncbi:MAG: hypothetical protein C4324_03185 [Blastocatellia bacterium]
MNSFCDSAAWSLPASRILFLSSVAELNHPKMQLYTGQPYIRTNPNRPICRKMIVRFILAFSAN